jgi:SAM-dependent methyltransferase
VAGVGILPGTMQTAIIRQNRLELTPETAGSVGLTDGGAARLIVADGHLVVEPAGQDVQLLGLHVPLRLDVLESLGWRSGDVVGVEPAGQRLTVRRLADPDDPALTTQGPDGAPLPPNWLVQTVTTGPRLEKFIESGHRSASLFGRLIQENLPGVERPAVMDFGCGCGRVARVLPQYVDCEITGCDLIESAVRWCERNLPGRYFTSTENPPVPLLDGQFDALYAISVLTHLDEAHQDAWLAEWRRLVRPGGVLLVTYRGEGFLSKGDAQRRERIEQLWRPTGMGFTTTDYWDGIFPGYYGGAYHTDAYVRERWGRYFELVELRPSTETGLVQDLAVMRRRG